MKLTLLTIFLSTLTTIYGQTFKKDWATFNNANWTMNFINDKSPCLDKPTQGKLLFKNKTDTTLTLTYYVYFKSEIDNAFGKKIKDWLFIQSCADYTFTKGQTNFISFDFNKYYYLLKPCHSCHTAINKDCQALADQLMTFILTKK